ncbi:MAG: adenosylmethionine decarboxylase [Telluria sp.]
MTAAFQPAGTHLLADLQGIDPALLADPARIDALLRDAAQAAGATILHSHFHTFGEPLGVTGVVLLAESHISIHTWPEHGFAAVDIFMCGAAQPERALAVIEAALQPAAREVKLLPRGAALPRYNLRSA